MKTIHRSTLKRLTDQPYRKRIVSLLKMLNYGEALNFTKEEWEAEFPMLPKYYFSVKGIRKQGNWAYSEEGYKIYNKS